MEAPHFVDDAPAAQGTAVNFAAGERVKLRGLALASVLASLMMTLFLAALDGTIVNTALPSILRDINGYDRYTWPIISYLLTSTTMIPIMGKLSDQFGRKWFLIAGVVVFLAGSALSGLSKEFATLLGTDPMNMFILFRGFQGLGGGTLMGLVFTLVGDIFTPSERARWQGLFTAVFALSSVFGPTAGGYITDTWGWPWIFYVNLPLGIIALFLLVRFLPTHISPKTNKYKGWAGIRRIDFIGAFLAAGATVCLVLALTFGGGVPPNGWAWDAWQSYASFGAAAGLLVLFLLNEAFLAKEPILPLDLFKNQVFAAGALLSIGIGMALYAVALYLPLFIQDVMGKSPTESGLLVTPLTLSMAVTAVFGGQLIAKVGRYQWLSLIGTVVMGFGIYLLSQLPANADISLVIRGMVVTGLGLGMVQPVLTLAVQNAIPRIRLGTGTGAVTYLRSMGQLLGIAVVGAVANSVFSSDLATRLPSSVSQLPASARSQLLNPTILQQVLGDPSKQQQIIMGAQQQADASVPQIVAQQAPAIIQQQLPAAIAQATASIPPGPDHAAQVAAVTQQVTQQVTASVTQQLTAAVTSQVNSQVATTLHDLFSASRLSLAAGIDQAFFVGVIVCAAIFVVTLFLKDVPLTARAPATAPAVQATVLREAATFNGEALPPAAFQQTSANGALRLAGGSAAPFVVEPKGSAAALAATNGINGSNDNLESLTWGALGLTLSSLAREAESANADPRLLSALSEAVDGRYPHSWSTEERAQAVARDMVTPLAQALLSAYVGAANPYSPAVAALANGVASKGANGAANGAGVSYAAALGSNGNGNGATVASGNSYPGNGSSGNGYAPATSYPATSYAAANSYPGASNGAYGGNGANGANSSGTYAQPWAVPSGAEEYPTIVQPRKKVRVTRRLVVDGHVVGEQALEDVVPADADTEAAAAALRSRLDSMPRPEGAGQSGQWQNSSADSIQRTR